MQALERIMAILESVSRSPSGVPPVRVAEETGLSLSTVVRLMQSLHDDEVLLRSNATGQYRIGPRLIGIVGRSTRSFDARAAAAPILEQLRDVSGGETASLHVRSGTQRICVAAAYTTHSSGRIVPTGLPLPLAGSAVGHVLLAQLGEQALGDVVASLGLNPDAEEQLRKRVAQVQVDGYAESVNDSVEGVRGVAVPLASEGNGAISVSGPTDRFVADMVPSTLIGLRHAAELFEQSGLRLDAHQFV